MNTLEIIMGILNGMPSQTYRGTFPQTILSEVFNADSHMLMEFLLAVEEIYYLDFKDFAANDEISLGGDLVSFGNWSIQQFADYIDIHGELR